jgi:hypothetical protein
VEHRRSIGEAGRVVGVLIEGMRANARIFIRKGGRDSRVPMAFTLRAFERRNSGNSADESIK